MNDLKLSLLKQMEIRALLGGYFFGTVPDGRKVGETIHTFGRWPRYDSPMLKLEARWQGEMKSFGCGYSCGIGDTVTEGAPHFLTHTDSSMRGPPSTMIAVGPSRLKRKSLSFR